MANGDYFKRLRMGRRRFLAGAASAGIGGAGLVLVGCGDDDDDGGETPTNGETPEPTATSGNGADPTATTPSEPTISGFEWIQNEPDFTLEPKAGGTFRYGTPIRAASLDPVQSASFESAAVYTPVYSRLLRGQYGPEMDPYNPWSLEVTGDLAEDWEQADDTTLILSLRSGVKWQNVDPVNGREFTAEDAKFTLDQFTGSAEFADLLPLANVEATDDTTLTLTTNRPVNYLVQALTENRIVMLPHEVADADGDFSQRAIGTGPFIMGNYVPGTSVSYSANPDYWREGYPYMEGLEFESLADAASSRSAFIAGNYDYVREGIGAQEIQSVMGERPDAVVLKLQSRWQSNIFHIGLNERVAPYNDPRVRTALSKAFDRAAYGDTALGGDYNVLGPYPWIGWFDEEPDLGDAYVSDLAAARAMLEEADATDITIPIEYFPYSQAITDQLEFMAAMLQEIGVTLNLQSLEYTTFASKYFAGQMEHGTVGFIATFPRWQPLSARVLWHSTSPKNYYGLNDSELDSALETVVTTMDEEEQRSAYQTAFNRIVTAPHIIQLVEGPTYFTHDPRLHNFKHNMFNDWGGWGYQQMEQFWLDA